MTRDVMLRKVLREHLSKLSMDNSARSSLVDNLLADILGVLQRCKNERLGTKTQAVIMTPDCSQSVDLVGGRNNDGETPKEFRVQPPEAV